MFRRSAFLRRIGPTWRLRLVLVTIGALLCGALAWQVMLGQLRQDLEQSLLVSHRAIQTEIDRFRYLPQVAGEDARIRAALSRPRPSKRPTVTWSASPRRPGRNSCT